jgi:hypothetical protein
MTSIQKYTSSTAAGAEVNKRTEAHMAQHQGVVYQEALHAVLTADPELAQAYGQPSTRIARMAATDKVHRPGDIVHQRAVALHEKDGHLDYNEAIGCVLAEDPALKTAYARF